MKQHSILVLVLSTVVVSALAGCSTTQGVSASKQRLNQAARSIVGTELIGARGATAADQDKIDDTVAGLCGARAWTTEECERHDMAR